MYNSSLMSYNREITTLTGIEQKVIKQKFYDVKISDFVDVDVGNNAWDEQIMTNLLFDVAGDGLDGFQVDASNISRTPRVDIAWDGKLDKRGIWKKIIIYTKQDLEQMKKALDAGKNNFDVIEGKMETRKRNFDQMLLKVAFLGNPVLNGGIDGLLNNSDVTINTTILNSGLGSLTDSDFQSIVGKLMNAYTDQTEYSELKPNRLIIPYKDHLALTTMNSIQFPMISKLKLLENIFKETTGDEDFKILSTPYAQASINGTQNNTYVLYKKDPNVLVFDLPIEYQTSQFFNEGWNNFNYGFGQVGGVRVFRPQEVLYFSVANA